MTVTFYEIRKSVRAYCLLRLLDYITCTDTTIKAINRHAVLNKALIKLLNGFL